MPARPEPKGARKCCCCIPIRGGVMILACFYFLGGAAAAAVALTLPTKAVAASIELTVTVRALSIVLAVLSITISVASAIGIFATARLHPRAARIYYVLFYAWFLLQLALDIAIIVMFFTKTLDPLIPECKGITGRRSRIGQQHAQRDCETARNKMSWYYTVSMVVRSAIGYYFVRRVASFSRHCADRAAARLNPPSTPMVSASTFSPTQPLHPAPSRAPLHQDAPLVPVGGTMFASNFSTRPTRTARTQYPTRPDQNTASPRHLDAPEAYPRSYQASAESIQAEDPVKEAPPYYSHSVVRTV